MKKVAPGIIAETTTPLKSKLKDNVGLKLNSLNNPIPKSITNTLKTKQKKEQKKSSKNDEFDSKKKKPRKDATSQSNPTKITEKKILLQILVKLM